MVSCINYVLFLNICFLAIFFLGNPGTFDSSCLLSQPFLILGVASLGHILPIFGLANLGYIAVLNLETFTDYPSLTSQPRLILSLLFLIHLSG